MIGYYLLAFGTVTMPIDAGKALDVFRVILRFIVYEAFDNESKSPVFIPEVELKAGVEATTVLFKR